MMIGQISLIGRFVEWLLGGIVDKLTKSPLEQDFGEASESDIQAPQFEFRTRCPIEGIYPPLLEMFGAIDGLSAEHVKKIAVRVNELPVERSATYRFQVRDGQGEATELQLTLTKLTSSVIDVEFHSSRELIAVVSGAFPGAGGGGAGGAQRSSGTG